MHIGGRSCGDAHAGAGNDLANTSTSSAIDSRNPSSEFDDPDSSDCAENNVSEAYVQRLNSRPESNREDSSTIPRQTAIVSIAAQQNSQTSSYNTEESGEDTNRILDMDDMSGQPLLPEDDGMGALRRRIHAIRDLGYTSAEQARMIHDLMTEKYNASRTSSTRHLSPIRSPSPCSQSPARSGTPTSRRSGVSFDQSPASSTSTAVQQEACHNLTADDLTPTYYPRAEPESPFDDIEDLDTEEVEELCLGCPHYKRNVKLQCYDCKKWYTCRFCHDEVEDHHLNRPKTENMLCMLCGHAQPAAHFCKQCGEQTAQYYCPTCKLWDNNASKSIYHCSDCGICRIGQGIGKDFFHCKTCSVCLPVSIETTHKCIERSTQCDCPICGDYMFTSPETVVFMRCGHSIHQRCLSEFSKTSYRCPICNKTVTNMETTFRNLDRAIQSQPMPAEFKDTNALIYCNDCSAKSVVKYHWLGLRCDMCESYNTAQLRLLQGDVLDFPEQNIDDESFAASRQRSSSHAADDSVLSPLASLQIDPSSAPGSGAHPRFSSPLSADVPGQASPYNLTRGRAVSPVISNYFGIPSDRRSEKSRSTSFFGFRAHQTDETDADGELHIWGTKFKYRYGFLSRATDPEDDVLASEDEDDGEDASSSDVSDNANDNHEEEDDEDDGEDASSSDVSDNANDNHEEEDDEEEPIYIFGHR